MIMFFFFNDTATTEIYTLSLHDALPISGVDHEGDGQRVNGEPLALGMPEHLGQLVEVDGLEWCHEPILGGVHGRGREIISRVRSEEHTSELQSRQYLVCRLLLEKKIIRN